MSSNFNFTNSIGSDLKTQFVADYGKLATGFVHVDPLGNQKFNTQWPILVIIIGIILSVFAYIGSRPDKDEKTGESKERTGLQKFLLGLTWLFILCAIFGAGYGAYLYFAIYLPEYFKWFETLPIEAKGKLGMITTIDKVSSNQETMTRKHSQPNRF